MTGGYVDAKRSKIGMARSIKELYGDRDEKKVLGYSPILLNLPADLSVISETDRRVSGQDQRVGPDDRRTASPHREDQV
jgi:hypothetical protein